MGRLFWKFFFVIWAAQLIGTMSVMLAVELVHRYEEAGRIAAGVASPTNLLVESASATLHHGGPDALRKVLDKSAKHPLIVIDETNRDILGRAVNPGAVREAREGLQRWGSSDAVRQINIGDGHTYLLFIDERYRPSDAADSRPKPPHGAKLLPIEPLVAHFIASFVVAALLAQYVSRPIRSLREAFLALAAGHLRIDVGKRKDELADLLPEFGRMATSVTTLINRQRQLLHDVSHELRSPLARIQVALGLARQQPEKAAGLFDRIDSEVARVDQLVGELLTLSRLEARDYKIVNDEICIDEVLDDIAESAHFEAESTGKGFHYSGNSGATVKGSADLIHRAIENVVRNAIKYTDPGSAINVFAKLESESGILNISISDNGPGVPTDELVSIFEPFFRGNKTKLAARGHGLGLAIAKRVVENHHGSIRATNMAERGLRVEIRLPVSRRG